MKDIEIIQDQLNKAKKLLEELPVEQGELIHDYVDYALRVVKKHDFIGDVSKSVAKQYAEFCVRCDRDGLPLLELDDYIKQYCC